MRKHSRARRCIFRGTAVLLATLLALVALEVLLRTVESLYPGFNRLRFERRFRRDSGTADAVKNVYDPVLGWRNEPDSIGTTWGRPMRLNSKGLRGGAVSYGRTPGKGRILVLGDSCTFGEGVSDEETFCAVLEAGLREGGRPTEVLNAGVIGWGTDQEFLYLKTEGHRFRPDLVLLVLYRDNDLLNNVLSSTYGCGKPYFSGRGADGDLTLENVPVPLALNERVEVRLLAPFHGSALVRTVVKRTFDTPAAQGLWQGLGFIERSNARLIREIERDEAEHTADIVKDLASFCRTRAFDLAVVSFGVFLDGETPPHDAMEWERQRMRLEAALLDAVPGLNLLDLDGELQSSGITNEALVEGNPSRHLNVFGNRTVGSALQVLLERAGLLRW